MQLYRFDIIQTWLCTLLLYVFLLLTFYWVLCKDNHSCLAMRLYIISNWIEIFLPLHFLFAPLQCCGACQCFNIYHINLIEYVVWCQNVNLFTYNHTQLNQPTIFYSHCNICTITIKILPTFFLIGGCPTCYIDIHLNKLNLLCSDLIANQ